jgi:hypothetical protein
VTLETNLAGQGEVPVTYPAEARAQLDLPAPLEARVLVQRRPSGAVMADVQKVPGAPVRLALSSGDYDAVVAQKSGIVECHVTVSDDHVTELDPGSCKVVTPAATVAKGDAVAAPAPDPDDVPPADPVESMEENDRWAIEAGIGLMSRHTDAYTDRLQEFGYQPGSFSLPVVRLSVGASRVLVPHLALLLQATTLSGDSYTRSVGESTDTAKFHGYGLALFLRAFTDLGSWFGVYAQAGVGAGLGVVTLDTQQTGVSPSVTDDTYGYLLSGAVGFMATMPRVVTFYWEGGYDYAPVIHNLIGDTHDAGGFSAVMGIRFRLGDHR